MDIYDEFAKESVAKQLEEISKRMHINDEVTFKIVDGVVIVTDIKRKGKNE